MRWNRNRSNSDDVIDLRGAGDGRRRGGMPIPIGVGGGGLGVVGVVIYLAITLLGGGQTFDVPRGFDDTTRTPESAPIPADQDPERDLRDFSAYVFTNAQERWEQTFADQNRPYRRAKLVLFRAGVDTACGSASSAVGPFYCPADQRVYLDLSFYGEMERRLGASGDFAWAYVIAHEMGHHVQTLTGVSDEVRRLSREDPDQANELSVRQELQADCYAGVWARSVFTAGDLEDGDLDEAFGAAEAVGDDRLQKQAGRRVNPETFTHGTSEQRRTWFRRGEQAGEPAACDTFAAEDV